MYAAGTTVAPEKSKAEIEGLLRRYGADQFVSGWSNREAMIGFRAKDRFVRFVLPIPDAESDAFWLPSSREHAKTYATRQGVSRYWRLPARARELYEAEVRRLWRALALVIKAKLEAVESGITSFEEAFASNIVLPSGRTVWQEIEPQIAAIYQGVKKSLLLLSDGHGDSDA